MPIIFAVHSFELGEWGAPVSFEEKKKFRNSSYKSKKRDKAGQ